MTNIWSVGSSQYSGTTNQNVFEEVNPKTQKLVESCKICGQNKSQTFTK